MGTRVFALSDGRTTGEIIEDRMVIAGQQTCLWHVNPNQAKDLFDSSVSSGWGFWRADNKLILVLGSDGDTSGAVFAVLNDILTYYPDDDLWECRPGDSGSGTLGLGGRVATGIINWSYLYRP